MPGKWSAGDSARLPCQSPPEGGHDAEQEFVQAVNTNTSKQAMGTLKWPSPPLSRERDQIRAAARAFFLF
jgi:hypothetical protein